MIDRLLSSLTSEKPQTRAAAVRSLGRIGTSAEKVLPNIANLFEDSDSAVVLAASVSMATFGEDAVRLAVEIANDEQASQLKRKNAIFSLGRYPEFALRRVAALSEILECDNQELREASAHAICMFAQHAYQQHGWHPCIGEDDQKPLLQLLRAKTVFVENALKNSKRADITLAGLKHLLVQNQI